MRDISTRYLYTSTLLLLLCSTYKIILATPTPREALEIVIGGGGGDYDAPSPDTSQNCPPPPPPPCPPPPTLQPPSPVAPPTPIPTKLSRVARARNVILEFKKRITIDPMHITDSWQPNRNACEYSGFQCVFIRKFTETGIYAVQFNGYNLGGPNLGIDNFIDKLEDLTIFHANTNQFKGTIPDLSNPPSLFELDLSNNKYQGEFPKSILSGNNLVYLDLRFNGLSGFVPPQIFNMINLLVLFLNDNHFEQEIPSSLGSTQVAFLTLDSNKFTGQIPKSIGNTANTLLEVLFLNNTLTGCLPYEIGLLKNARVFDVSLNQLTGPIPLSFGCLAGMQYLVLANNQFYGPVPESVCKLPLLKNLTLCNNFFTQVGPECMKLIRAKTLDVTNNCILGLPNQRSPRDCDDFFNQPKYCPESNMNSYIPCKGKVAYLQSDMALERVPQVQSAMTYHALSPTYN